MNDFVKISTHTMYKTISHIHLDHFVELVLKESPSSSLLLVECADGRWFVEVAFGARFNALPGVSCPAIEPYIEPLFFNKESDALAFALACIKKTYPKLENVDLEKCAADYFAEEDEID